MKTKLILAATALWGLWVSNGLLAQTETPLHANAAAATHRTPPGSHRAWTI